MRPLLVILVWLLCLGIVQGYLSFKTHNRRNRKPAAAVEILLAEGDFAIEVALTYEAVPDDFTEDASLELTVNGKPVARTMDRLGDQRLLRFEDVKHLVVGRNEVMLKSSSSPGDLLRPRAAQVRVFRGPHRLGERTIWAESGQGVGGTFVIEVPDSADDDAP